MGVILFCGMDLGVTDLRLSSQIYILLRLDDATACKGFTMYKYMSKYLLIGPLIHLTDVTIVGDDVVVFALRQLDG